MSVSQEMLKKYAELAIKTGINLREHQCLVIQSDIGTADFARMCAEAAYDAGADYVMIDWSDEKGAAKMFKCASDEYLYNIPQWMVDRAKWRDDRDFAFLWIDSADPDALADAPAERIANATTARRKALHEHSMNTSANRVTWSIVALPTEAWAKKVFPDSKSSDEAMDRLYDAIFKSVRLDTPDPVKAWQEHIDKMQSNAEWLNAMDFDAIHIETEFGTDLTVGLAKNNLFCAAGEKRSNADHRDFIPNMPTEEVFGTPDMNNINGYVKSSMGLNHQGQMIRDIELWFENGKVVKFDASEGRDALKGILDADEGAKSLGEIAFVPYDSPISNLGVFFYNTLFDENAACHLALGHSYPGCIKGGIDMSEDELAACGANASVMHVDFMFGSKHANITGIKNGKETPIFRDGNWAEHK